MLLKRYSKQIIVLALIIVLLPFTTQAVQQQTSLNLRAQTTCEQNPTPWFTNYYGQSTPSTLLPEGAIVEAFNARGQRAGCFTIHTQGMYGFMRVYGEDIEHSIPGMQAGEEVLFFVDGQRVNTSPENVHWQNDWSNNQVSLLEASPTPDPNNAPVIKTSSLRKGRVNTPYKAFVIGHDLDLTDDLTMTAENLPLGITFGQCKTKTQDDKKAITCTLSGKPSQAARKDVIFKLTDGEVTTSHILSLEVRK